MQHSQRPQIKKIQPYPFEATLEGHGKKITVHIRRITQQGAIAQVGQHLLVVGEEYKLTCELPAMKAWAVATIKVMKTYDQFVNQNEPKGHVERMAEFYFIAISTEHRQNIVNFTHSIKQV